MEDGGWDRSQSTMRRPPVPSPWGPGMVDANLARSGVALNPFLRGQTAPASSDQSSPPIQSAIVIQTKSK